MAANRFIDIAGERFGKLIAVKYVGRGKWECQCDCGKKNNILGKDLRRETGTRSCGCLRPTAPMKTHGLSGTPMYFLWRSMISRCHSPASDGYRNYGGRGIKVCRRWRNSFELFLKDVGERPNGLTLHRKNNDGNYEPSNCKWATDAEQRSNAAPVKALRNFSTKEILLELKRREGARVSKQV